MPITFPRTFPDGKAGRFYDCSLDLVIPQSAQRTVGGATAPVEYGEPYWVGRWRTTDLLREDIDIWEAWLASLHGGAKTFWGYHPEKAFPRAYMKTGWTGLERALQNIVTNPTGTGAVVGNPGTPPTGWIFYPQSGLQHEIVDIGANDGVNYIDVRWTGNVTTATGVVSHFNNLTLPIATAMSGALSVQLVNGTLNNVGEFQIRAGFGGAGQVNFTPSATLQRYSFSQILQTTDAKLTLRFRPLAIGTPVDFTLRLGLPFLSLVLPFTGRANLAAIANSNDGLRDVITIGSNTGTLAAGLLPPAFDLRAGDLLNADRGGGRLSLHRVVSPENAGGSVGADNGTWIGQIEPPLPTDVVVGNQIFLEKPSAKMRKIKHELPQSASKRVRPGVVTIDAMEDLLA